MSKSVWVFRCADGCTDIAASPVKSRMEWVKNNHKKESGHNGTVSLEDQEIVEETYDDPSNDRSEGPFVEMDEDYEVWEKDRLAEEQEQ